MLGTHTVQALNRSSDPRDMGTAWCQTTGLAENSHTPSCALTPESILGYIFAGAPSLSQKTLFLGSKIISPPCQGTWTLSRSWNPPWTLRLLADS